MLILDEPTASLDRHEVEMLFAVMRKLAARGIGIVFVTHFLDQVYAICDRITVLRNGRLVGERETAALPRLELVRMMLGRELAETTGARAASQRDDRRATVCARFEDYGKRRLCRAVRSRPAPAARWSASPACSAPAAPRRRG